MNSTLIYDDKNKILHGWGKNTEGTIGAGVRATRRVPQKVGALSSQKKNRYLELRVISCGKTHCLGLTSQGLFAWGETGLKSDDTPQKIPMFNDPHSIISIACGDNFSLVATFGGLFGWGDNYKGQLGMGHQKCVSSPQKIDFFSSSEEILSISCGSAHCLALTSNGLFSWGANYFGQLGQNNTSDQSLPQKMDFFSFPEEMLSISCGSAHCLALTSNGLFSWGCNYDGQLGLGHRQHLSLPQKINFFRSPQDLVSLHCGEKHCIVFTRSEVFGWGQNCSGQLAMGNSRHLGMGSSKNCDTPQKISFFETSKEILSFYCGPNHCLAVTTKGIRSWGYNYWSQLGLRDNSNRVLPSKVDFFPNPTDFKFKTMAEFEVEQKSNRKKSLLLLCCFRKFSPDSAFGVNVFPLDLFKQVLYWARLTTSANIPIQLIATKKIKLDRDQ